MQQDVYVLFRYTDMYMPIKADKNIYLIKRKNENKCKTQTDSFRNKFVNKRSQKTNHDFMSICTP